MRILVTGSAGFIGFHLAKRLLADGHEVFGIDCLNDYYDVSLKEARLEQLAPSPAYTHHRVRLEDGDRLEMAYDDARPDRVIHLAAQAGVRHSLVDPHAYVGSNLVGFVNLLEICRHRTAQHLLFASTSSVYGANTALPSKESHHADHPLSLYAATKRANELMAHSYSHLFGVPATGMRLFTVYGPWGRPDMALARFTRAILGGEAIDLYNGGAHRRDWTYVDDVVEAITRLMDKPPVADPSLDTDHPDPSLSRAPFRLVNLGGGRPVELVHLVALLETALGCKVETRNLAMQPGDVAVTHADTARLEDIIGPLSFTELATGVDRFIDWYRTYYAVGEA